MYDAWQNRREHAIEQAEELTKHLQKRLEVDRRFAHLRRLDLPSRRETGAVMRLTSWRVRRGSQISSLNGSSTFIAGVARRRAAGALDIVRLTLDKMARGGIYDHLAGGFARYSVDEQWLVPHFEKMLYDNALLVVAYLEAFQVTGSQH